MYCNLGFVLQEEGWLHERVSQYKNCIVTGAAGGLGKNKLYCDIAWWVENCIAREGLLASVLQLGKLYCNLGGLVGWNCIGRKGKLYCNIEVCRKKKLYCNTPLCIVT